MSDCVLGYMGDDGKFTCSSCAPVTYAEDSTQTPAFQSDEWFMGEICCECNELIEREAKP